MLENLKTIELLKTAGKIYFYLCEYKERHKNILSCGIDLLFLKDISFFEKVLLVYARLTRIHSKRITQVRIKYSKIINYKRNILLKTIFDSFGFSKFITLPFSEDNPYPDEVIRCFFSGCNEIFYSNIYKLDKLLEDNDVIIDGGGNIGLFSLYAKNLRENTSCSEGNLLISDNVLEHKLDSKLIDFNLQTKYYDSQKIKLNTIDNVVFSTNTKK